MCGAEKAIEIASYGLIALFGARLVWVKGGAFIRALQWPRPEAVLALAGQHHHSQHHDGGRGHDHGHDHGDRHGHRDQHDDQHDHGHVHVGHCGHSHGPKPSDLAGPGGWWRGIQAIFTVGIRPCSGAILVLVFALAHGLFWAGVVATFVMGLGTAVTVAAIAVVAVSAKTIARRLSDAREGRGALCMRGLEFGAAGLVLLFGTGLLVGYIAAERVTCF
jgi:ABC-type nickel/cobalt efflux system permease component RcnA